MQVKRDHKACEGGPEAARGSAAVGLPPLLHGYEVYLAGGNENGMSGWLPFAFVCSAPACLCSYATDPPSYPPKQTLPAGEFAQTRGREVAALLKAAGAKQLSRPPAAAPTPRAGAGPCTSLILCEAPEPGAASSPSAAINGSGGQQPAAQGDAAAAAEQQQQAAVPVPPAVAAAKWYQKAAEGGVPVVRHGWLLDSISCYTIQPLSKYRL